MWLSFVLLGCSTEYGFSALTSGEGAEGVDLAEVPGQAQPVAPTDAPAAAPSQELVEPVWTTLPQADVTDGSATETRVLQGEPVREDSFTVGLGEPALTDILFVVDNSVSMQAVLDKLEDGLVALTQDGVFPPRTRIAVTSTTPESPMAPGRVFPGVSLGSVVKHDPGFAGLVTGPRLNDFRGRHGEAMNARMGLPGCGAWFAPTEKAAGSDVPCLLAHTQIAETAHQVEAGLTAFWTLTSLHEEARPRPGSSFNVIFVSDTHDPGVPETHQAYEGLMAMRPDPAKLQEHFLGEYEASGFRMHAIAPASRCSSEPWTGRSYFDAAEATGGLVLDVCTAEPQDYVALVRRIAEEGSHAQAPVVALSSRAEDVEEVRVNGQRVGFAVGASGRTVVLDDELTRDARSVKVRYRTPLSSVRPADSRSDAR